MENPTFNSVGGDKVEDEAVKALAVAVDAAHALFESVWVPGNVVVKEDVATLKVDALAGRLRSHKNLNAAFPELLLSV